MKFEFNANEFTCWDVLEYLKGTYGGQINGNCFSSTLLQRWIRLKKFPEAYGGHKIIHAIRYKELSNLLVLTIEGLNREDVNFLIGSFDNYEETSNCLIELANNILLITSNSTPSHHKHLYLHLPAKSNSNN